jgi:hypothetical protein
MSDQEWATASADERLELLRRDIKDIATAQNGLAKKFRALLLQLQNAAALVQTRQNNEAGAQTIRPENHQEQSKTPRGDA